MTPSQTEVSRDFYCSVLERRFYGDCSWKVTAGTFKQKTWIEIPCK